MKDETKDKICELIENELYELIKNGINDRIEENEWTIYAEIPDKVIERLEAEDFEIEQDRTKLTIRWQKMYDENNNQLFLTISLI